MRKRHAHRSKLIDETNKLETVSFLHVLHLEKYDSSISGLYLFSLGNKCVHNLLFLSLYFFEGCCQLMHLLLIFCSAHIPVAEAAHPVLTACDCRLRVSPLVIRCPNNFGLSLLDLRSFFLFFFSMWFIYALCNECKFFRIIFLINSYSNFSPSHKQFPFFWRT